MSGKPCEVPGCTAPCRRGQLMCRDHWFQVPAPLRAMVGRTWREFGARDRQDRDQTMALLRSYREAVKSAVASITVAAT